MPMTLQEQTARAVALLRRLIATPRVSRDEAAAATLLHDHLAALGLEPRRHANNVWCLSRGFSPDRPTILLNAHLDTVKPVSGWERDPLDPALEGDTLYGLGSNDCGGGLVSLLEAFLALEGRLTRHNLVYLASAEEEVSGRDGIEAAIPILPAIDFAVVGEPTGMQPAIAEKGLMVIDATARGKAGHAARDEGDNAIYHAMRDIQWLSSWTFPKVSPLLGPVKHTVTIVNAGTQHNVIPDTCAFTIDVRTNECYTNREVFDHLAAHLSSELRARSFRLSSSRIDPGHPFVRACVRAGLTPFGSPTLSDQALMPWPSLKLGPGQSARSHTAGEHILVSEIERAIAMYVTLLQDVDAER